MRKRTIALIAILTALLAACTEKTDYNTLLVRADSLMNLHPDSALNILESISTESPKTKADRAYYALLLTQARDKNYIVQTDDSLIRIAVRYYDSMRDNRMQARAYYLWGSVCRDKNRQTEAIEKYIRATDLAQKAGDEVLLGRIYANAGYIYYLQKFYAKADSIYRQAEQISIRLKDTSLQISSLAMQGNIQLYQKKISASRKETATGRISFERSQTRCHKSKRFFSSGRTVCQNRREHKSTAICQAKLQATKRHPALLPYLLGIRRCLLSSRAI